MESPIKAQLNYPDQQVQTPNLMLLPGSGRLETWTKESDDKGLSPEKQTWQAEVEHYDGAPQVLL
jgi:hypothetical protein